MASEWHGFRRTFPDMVAYAAWKRINAMHEARRRSKHYKRNWYRPISQAEAYAKTVKTLRVLTRFLARHRELRVPGFGTFRVVPNRWPSRTQWSSRHRKVIHLKPHPYRVVFYPDEHLIETLNSS